MQKKIMAAAVAGALALPVTALAQTSTVNIYGRITYEYGIADQGNNRPNTDYADTPGGSAIGFRGEEKLGGNLSAWFQCESSADVRGFDQSGFCTRNSAVGFKGGFGNIFFGRWDTPFKRAMNVGTVGAEETGILGQSFLAFGGSGGSNATLNAVAGQESVFGETMQRQRFKRRETGLTYYETPSWGGFQVMGAFSTGNAAADNAAVNGQNNDKPRIWSIGGAYTAGPLGIGIGYEKHVEFGLLGGVANLDDRGWGASAAYTFGGFLKVGATYLDREWEMAPGREVKRKTATIGLDWAIAGPHSLQAQYTWAGDSKGNGLSGIGGNGGATAPRGCSAGGVNATATACNIAGNEIGVGDTGAYSFSVAYSYAFSKRTRVKVAYVRLDNENNTSAARIGNTAGLIGNGQTVDAYGFHISHSF